MSDTVARSDERHAWAWVAHLRAGGTTPWAAWAAWAARYGWPDQSAQTIPAQRAGRYLPGAQQLELLRRLNLAAAPAPVPAALADRVLRASAPGRGRPDLELVGAGIASPFGPRPVDPADLPDDELVRVATSLLAEDVVAAGPPAALEPPPTRPWRRHYRLVGDPVLADPLRDQLVARGRPPGGRRPRILVLGAPADRMLADAFTARALDTGGPSWPEWVAILADRDHLAPRIDLAAVAGDWARRASPEQVSLVLDPAQVGRLVGVRRRLVIPVPLSAEAVDLARRVAAVLGLLVTPEVRATLLSGTFAPWLAATGGFTGGSAAEPAGGRLAVPEEHHAWLVERAERMRDELRRAGYAVVGGASRGDALAGLLPELAPGGVVHVADDGVLRLATTLLLRSPRPGPEVR